jgi:hypothetical protein
MDSTTRKMTIQALKMQVDVCRLQCACLSSDFETAPTFERRSALAHRWDEFHKTGYAAQFLLDLLLRDDSGGIMFTR